MVLPWLGWHLAWWLRSTAGESGATAIAAAILVAVLAAILVTQPKNRPIAVTCVLTGFFFSMIETTLTPHVAPGPVRFDLESGSRYSVLPIFLLWAAVIVGVDSLIQRRRGGHTQRQRGAHRAHATRRVPTTSLRPALALAVAVAALAAVLSASWVADFRNPGFRSTANWNWGQIAARWERDCRYSPSGEITVKAGATWQTLPCANIRE
jgi:hypothetical protein